MTRPRRIRTAPHTVRRELSDNVDRRQIPYENCGLDLLDASRGSCLLASLRYPMRCFPRTLGLVVAECRAVIGIDSFLPNKLVSKALRFGVFLDLIGSVHLWANCNVNGVSHYPPSLGRTGLLAFALVLSVPARDSVVGDPLGNDIRGAHRYFCVRRRRGL